ncbi:pyridoxamine 5'-phosphate oxidase family protein [Alteromonas sp. 5E99-2]|uniref:MSMEG_1061 family FMN-dependent PPOX-type flavoprotein n=1 Tax=Alteromonas sp. 5E99-2 TaxID=2817683 RepID=UPI001A99D244|nr:MSMEG_1061 family FMN-dependent PPOX-type flavoprotein [Alteromonas sp. 5E99-2]MBO1256375.1 pyridoxamine 5'-phosphate oxidase family protein [Alteromonas sp. 5E99-2]
MQGLNIDDKYILKNEAQLREQFGETTESIWAKAASFISEPMKEFIALSPFCCISSYDNTGRTDISPRGDAPGFVTVADSGELLIPDRPGNRRYDTIRNIMETRHVSLLFMIPDIAITLRVNGHAQVTFDPDILARFSVQGRLPQMALVITVQEAYGHCAKAILRGKVWQDDYKVDTQDAPTLASLMSSHLDLQKKEVEAIDKNVIKDIKDSMY